MPKQHFKSFFLFSLFLLAACNDNRYKNFTDASLINAPIAQVKFRNQATNVVQMSLEGDELDLTGTPFGYMRWSLANPQSPTLLFAASDNLAAFSPTPPFGFWRLDNLASGAVLALGQFSAMSGTMGASLVSRVAGNSAAKEVWRKPMPDGFGNSVRDLGYVYNAMAKDPVSNTVYGATPDSYVYAIDFNANTGLTLRNRYNYNASGSTVCCSKGAAVFANRLFIGMGTKLLMYTIASGGNLAAVQEIPTLQATKVVASENYLYVLHQPSGAFPNGQTYQPGIYMIDRSGRMVGFMQISPKVFAVYQDQYLYANVDGNAVNIYHFQP